MPSSEELRKKVRGLLERAQGFIDPIIRRELASRAFELAQRAALIAELGVDSERRKIRIAQYRSMLKDASLSQAQRRLIDDVLGDAEAFRAVPRELRSN